jgi:PPOX class probable F420-dependent enzyme
VIAVALLAGMFMVAAGAWALLGPGSFADAVAYPATPTSSTTSARSSSGSGSPCCWRRPGVTGLRWPWPACWWPTPSTRVNHAVDLDLGGRGLDPWGLAVLALLAAATPAVRLRQLGWVIGEVGVATTPTLARFMRQKTVLLTSYRRDGRPVGTPMSIAVDGRGGGPQLREGREDQPDPSQPRVAVAPSTARGRATGPALQAHARGLEGAEASHAARLLAAKHPLLYGLLVPLAHRAGRPKTGKPVHFELIPVPQDPVVQLHHRTQPTSPMDRRPSRRDGRGQDKTE